MKGMGVIRLKTVRLILAVISPCAAVFAAHGEIAAKESIRPLAVTSAVKAEMARYSLKAYVNTDEANVVEALLFTPRPVGSNPLPMVVYIPGRGEIGDVSLQFRQRAIFDRVTARPFQEKYPCFLLALTPPAKAKTLVGGMPGRPSAMQRAIGDFVLEVARLQSKPRVDMDRLYLTGFSYGGNGSYALAQHYPGRFAAVVPISALPPLPEYFGSRRVRVY